MSKLSAIRGMNDLLPEQAALWQKVETTARQILQSYGYREIRFPIVEYTELFKRSIGDVTDIVEKEMYTFEDRNGESLTLRPEGTACCVRAGEQHGLFYNQTQRLWYTGPMFRYEKPQKGRYRQFHQLGVESFGFATVDMDAEMIALSARLWKALGIDHQVELQLNTLGDKASRLRYVEALNEFLQPIKDQLDYDSQQRLEKNPLRILDSKDENTQALLKAAPRLHDYLDEESKRDFSELCARLDALGISYTINQNLVRGLDYYNKTVFEWVTEQLGAQGTICAGGRYDGLVEQLGGRSTPAVGFALGLERLVLMLEHWTDEAQQSQAPMAYAMAQKPEFSPELAVIIERLRDALPEKNLLMHCGGGSIKSQMKKADKSGAAMAIILGEQEVQDNTVAIKFLREQREQVVLAQAELIKFLQENG